jgi:hypothetical protein
LQPNCTSDRGSRVELGGLHVIHHENTVITFLEEQFISEKDPESWPNNNESTNI